MNVLNNKICCHEKFSGKDAICLQVAPGAFLCLKMRTNLIY
uniref:Uncharacterized protein n=1 Tax=Klebsiella pneumoniae TaxID=573 RepID=A0A411AM53_KLEPN|nr:hypothetical protein [Klebsiella pneumoniae]QAX89007.1 hypothetical protein [Klebsiella pneumoniae]UVD62842.1 hypothetical protein [Klebsiella pneumoniae]WCS70243.1 hypothetical protein [Klebsiella pneumoniae]